MSAILDMHYRFPSATDLARQQTKKSAGHWMFTVSNAPAAVTATENQAVDFSQAFFLSISKQK
jgi:hypothetical protein